MQFFTPFDTRVRHIRFFISSPEPEPCTVDEYTYIRINLLHTKEAPPLQKKRKFIRLRNLGEKNSTRKTNFDMSVNSASIFSGKIIYQSLSTKWTKCEGFVEI